MFNAFTREYLGISNSLQIEVNLLTSSGIVIRKLNGIWDTGASVSAISEKIAQDLQLISTGKCKQGTAGGERLTDKYPLYVSFNENVKFKVVALGANLGDIDFLVGMDIISQGNFSISNYQGKTKVSFLIPSDRDVDYVKQINDQNKRVLKAIGRNEPCPCGSGKKIKDCCGKKYGV